MLVLKILGVVVAILAFITALVGFEMHCYKKFSHRFFTMFTYIFTTIAIGLGMIGHYWYQNSLTSGGDVLNGIVVMILGGLAVLILIFTNFKKTNLLYGIAGSAIQLAIFGILAQISLVLFVILAVGAIIESVSAKPVYVVNNN